jgi:hypothetical protein
MSPFVDCPYLAVVHIRSSGFKPEVWKGQVEALELEERARYSWSLEARVYIDLAHLWRMVELFSRPRCIILGCPRSRDFEALLTNMHGLITDVDTNSVIDIDEEYSCSQRDVEDRTRNLIEMMLKPVGLSVLQQLFDGAQVTYGIKGFNLATD